MTSSHPSPGWLHIPLGCAGPGRTAQLVLYCVSDREDLGVTTRLGGSKEPPIPKEAKVKAYVPSPSHGQMAPMLPNLEGSEHRTATESPGLNDYTGFLYWPSTPGPHSAFEGLPRSILSV